MHGKKIHGSKATKSPVQNVDLWQRVLFQLRRHEVKLVWVKGHAGHEENERCDRLAVSAYGKDNKITDEGMKE